MSALATSGTTHSAHALAEQLACPESGKDAPTTQLNLPLERRSVRRRADLLRVLSARTVVNGDLNNPDRCPDTRPEPRRIRTPSSIAVCCCRLFPIRSLGPPGAASAGPRHPWHVVFVAGRQLMRFAMPSMGRAVPSALHHNVPGLTAPAPRRPDSLCHGRSLLLDGTSSPATGEQAAPPKGDGSSVS